MHFELPPRNTFGWDIKFLEDTHFGLQEDVVKLYLNGQSKDVVVELTGF